MGEISVIDVAIFVYYAGDVRGELGKPPVKVQMLSQKCGVQTLGGVTVPVEGVVILVEVLPRVTEG